MATSPEERARRKAARAAKAADEDQGFQPTGRHLDLARTAIEAAWMVHLNDIGRYAMRNRLRVMVTPPDAQAIYEGAKALGLREGAISDWQGDDTHTVGRPDGPGVEDGDHLIP